MKKTTILTLCTHKGLSRILSFYFRGHNAGFRETTATTTPFATFRGERENRVIVDMILGPLKPSARWCFVAAKLDFGSCLLGSIPHTSVKLNCQKHGAFQVDGWTWDIASFAVLSRIFREIWQPKVASADS